MRKTAAAVMALTILMTASGFTSEEFSLADLSNYQREFKSESIGACSSSSSADTWMGARGTSSFTA